MRKKLPPKDEVFFSKAVAEKVGVDGAIVYQYIAWCIREAYIEKVENQFLDRTWFWHSARSFRKIYPFWSEDKISRILQNLVAKDWLIADNQKDKDGKKRFENFPLRKSFRDRTLWYALSDRAMVYEASIQAAREGRKQKTPSP